MNIRPMTPALARAILVDIDRLLSFASLNDYFECDCEPDDGIHADDCMSKQHPEFAEEFYCLQAYLKQQFNLPDAPFSDEDYPLDSKDEATLASNPDPYGPPIKPGREDKPCPHGNVYYCIDCRNLKLRKG